MASCSAERQLNECPVCLEKFSNPQALPCHHTVCKTCVDQICDKGVLACPGCRKTCERNEVVFDFRQIQFQDVLKKSEKLEKLEKMENIEKPENPCELCEARAIKLWCEDCALLICELCSRNHLKAKAMKEHRLVRIQEKAQEMQTKMRTGLKIEELKVVRTA